MDTDTRDADARDTTPPDADGTPLEGSARRRFAISAFVALTLVAIISSTMPGSVLRNGVLTVTRPYLTATALDQDWGVFAPNPQRVSTFVVARVDHADGTVAEYGIPSAHGLSAYWDYRWRKYTDQLSQKNDTRRERAAFARWAVEQDRRAGGQPVRVTLVRHSSTLLPPGPEPEAGPWRERPIFSLPVGGR